MNQPEIVICHPKRTAVGRYGGAFVGAVSYTHLRAHET